MPTFRTPHKPRQPYTYAVVAAGVDLDGFYKTHLVRDDGKTVRVRRKRLAELRRAGRITS